MKQPVNLGDVLEQARRKTAQLRAASIRVPKRPPRVKPRTYSETMALCRAVYNSVESARRSGRLVKLSPAGYRLHWED